METDARTAFRIRVDGTSHDVDVDPDMPLLWVLRDELGILGPKYGCGIGACGACTVLIDGAPVRSCVQRIAEVEGEVTTIEGLGAPDSRHAVQEAWIEHQVAQCGYCQSGQIVSACALLAKTPSPTEQEIERAMAGNVCRCGTYGRIRAAIASAAERLAMDRPPKGDD